LNQPPGLLISEIYLSKQGEGLLTGTPSVFVRTSGCNLRCVFCDTPFASWKPEGTFIELPAILAQIEQLTSPVCAGTKPPGNQESLHPVDHIVITGGEPMVTKGLPELCHQLRERGFHITIETAGTVYRELPCDLMSISPKFANSTPTVDQVGQNWHVRHERTRFQPDLVRRLIHQYDFQLKFVVDSPADLTEIVAFLSLVFPDLPLVSSDSLEHSIKRKILLMPQGIDEKTLLEKQEWLQPLCDQWGFSYCPRSHIYWYGNRRGT